MKTSKSFFSYAISTMIESLYYVVAFIVRLVLLGMSLGLVFIGGMAFTPSAVAQLPWYNALFYVIISMLAIVVGLLMTIKCFISSNEKLTELEW